MSLRSRITGLLKYNRLAYSAYYTCASAVMRFFGAFAPIDDRLILFNSYAGRSFNDSPRAVYEALIKDPRFTGYRFVWAFHNPQCYEVDGCEKIRTDTPRYFLTALKARLWITNSSVERGLRFKKPATTYVNTWHGTPIKKMGSDIGADNQSFKSKGKTQIDAMCVQGEYEAAIWARGFGIPDDRLIRTGLPRNDELASTDCEKRLAVRAELQIPDEKKTILYCPTFREFTQDGAHAIVMKPPIDISSLEQSLGEEYVLLVRAHYEVSKLLSIEETSFVRDVTDYPDLNGLILASDVLVSDYSSVFFDYSITGKPMLHFTYDYDEYAEKRGMYFDIRDWLNGSDTQEGLIEILENLDIDAESRRTRAFRDKFVDYYGNAAKGVSDVIYELLN